VLPKNARLTTSEDFAQATKSGARLTSEHLVGYLYIKPALDNPTTENAKCGLIVNKSVGGSVKRHRIARQIRHDLAPLVSKLPTHSLLAIRVLKESPSFTEEVNTLVSSLLTRTTERKARV
jgi:ribonuclease P protein component